MHGPLNVKFSTNQFFNGMLVTVFATHDIKRPSSHSFPQPQKPILKQTEARFQSTIVYKTKYMGLSVPKLSNSDFPTC
jgi:hypothetical protein